MENLHDCACVNVVGGMLVVCTPTTEDLRFTVTRQRLNDVIVPHINKQEANSSVSANENQKSLFGND